MFDLSLISQQETAEGWESLVAGLAELASGLATAEAQDQGSPALLEGLFPDEALLQLLHQSPSAQCSESVLQIAAALPNTAAGQSLQTW